jgi:hypothetical protein
VVRVFVVKGGKGEADKTIRWNLDTLYLDLYPMPSKLNGRRRAIPTSSPI